MRARGSSPHASRRSAISACRTAKRSGATGLSTASSGRLGRPLDERRRRGVRRRGSLVRLGDACESGHDLVDQLGRAQRHGLAVEVEQPASPAGGVRERRLEHERPVILVGGGAMAARGALDEPGRGGQHADRRDLLALAELPRCAVAPLRRIELGGNAEVALATRREADVAADAREPERADRLAVVVASRRGTTDPRAGTGCRGPSCASTARRTRSPSTGRRSCAAWRRADSIFCRRCGDLGGEAAAEQPSGSRRREESSLGFGRPSARFCRASRSGSAYANWPSSR